MADRLSSDYYQHSRTGLLRRWIAPLSARVRRRAWLALLAETGVSGTHLVLDLGVTPAVDLVESNAFEECYPHPGRLIGCGIESMTAVRQRYPHVRFVQADARALPFSDACFDLVVSNATIEHVGNREQQAAFVREVMRVARTAVIVTPNRWFPLELHTFLPLLHYLPRHWHRWWLSRLGFAFYAEESHLRLLGPADLRALFPADAASRVRLGLLGATLVATARRAR